VPRDVADELIRALLQINVDCPHLTGPPLGDLPHDLDCIARLGERHLLAHRQLTRGDIGLDHEELMLDTARVEDLEFEFSRLGRRFVDIDEPLTHQNTGRRHRRPPSLSQHSPHIIHVAILREVTHDCAVGTSLRLASSVHPADRPDTDDRSETCRHTTRST